ncbi:hypothetical protein ES695_01875 [Candidatus Atribacteria bacterium 1244-E10-H5-B2]|nr:MAG: hypothetical protein ES695_01875 [Candidatus Atribacteria bacterium 1244-E10-H5-B2]
MAKVKGPLFSLDARGQIAKTLVYMGWKGKKDVREYVIPANPKTELQKKQRAYFKTAVGEWHTSGFTADDVKAWNLLALALKEALSGFNIYLRLKLDALIDLVDWTPIYGVSIAATDGDTATLTATGFETLSYMTYYGTSKTAMFNTTQGDAIAGDISMTFGPLVDGVKYYVYVKDVFHLKSARTGIYEYTFEAP